MKQSRHTDPKRKRGKRNSSLTLRVSISEKMLFTFQHITPKCGYATVSSLVGRSQRHIDIPIRTQEKRHVRQRIANCQMLQVYFHPRTRSITGQGERPGSG